MNSDIEGTECAFAFPVARRLADHGKVSYHHCTGLRTNVYGYLLWNDVMGVSVCRVPVVMSSVPTVMRGVPVLLRCVPVCRGSIPAALICLPVSSPFCSYSVPSPSSGDGDEVRQNNRPLEERIFS